MKGVILGIIGGFICGMWAWWLTKSLIADCLVAFMVSGFISHVVNTTLGKD